MPPAAAAYCRGLWQQYQFQLRVVRPRQTRLGDFRVLPTDQTLITVNADLNPYAFLITYVHEVAHAEVHRTYRFQWRVRRLKPHGSAWKSAFSRLMQPMLTEAVFPLTILEPLRSYLRNPAATTAASPALMLALRQTEAAPTTAPDEAAASRRVLRDLREGSTFRLGKKTFVRGTLRRTRVVCKETTSGRSYAVLAHALVEVTEP